MCLSLVIITVVLGYVHSQTCDMRTCKTELCSEASRACRLPSDDPNMRFCPVSCSECIERGGHCNSASGSLVGHHTRVQCGPGYRLHTDQDYDVLACDNGTWVGEIPQCLAQCPPLVSDSVFPKCLSGAKEVDCSKPMMPRTTATVLCRPSHTEYPNLVEAGVYKRTMNCRYSGKWSHSLPVCKPVCGVSKGSSVVTATVVDGKDTPLGVFPWHAALYRRENQTRWTYICGGSLITNRIVLTAAHCVILDQNDLQLAFAKYFRVWGAEWDEPYTVKRGVSAISLPREFDWGVNSLAWDIALLFMDQPVQVNSYVMPVCRSASLNLALDETPKGFVVGWGKTESGNDSDVLQHNDISIISYELCNRKIPRAIAVDKFCGSKNLASVVEKGDSGGGLTAMFNHQHHLVGIVSIKYGDVSVFTNVSWSPHVTWVEDQINNFDEDSINRCTGYTFQCGMYGACLERSVRCNGRRDCPDGSDEFGCPAINNYTHHRPDDGANHDQKCRLPAQPANGRYQSLQCAPGDRRGVCLATPGTAVPAFWLLEYSCHDGHTVNSTRSPRSTCEDGQWSNPLECIKLCPGLHAAFADLSCEYAGGGASCREAVRAGTTAVATCRPGHRRVGGGDAPLQLRCLATGRWSQTVQDCAPDPDQVGGGGPTNHTGGMNHLNLYLGDVCKVDGSAVSTCQFVKNCPLAIALLKLRKKLPMCNFASGSAQPVVCCERTYAHPTTTHRPDPFMPVMTQRPKPASFPRPPEDITDRPDDITGDITTQFSNTEYSTTDLPAPSMAPPPAMPAAVGAISKKMCNEYAKYVYVRVPNPKLPDEILSIDNCVSVQLQSPSYYGHAFAKEYPHMALIGFGNKDSILWLCGGSLISDKFVLTASRCVDGNTRRGPARWVRLGEYILDSIRDEEMDQSQPVDYEISEISLHPEYGPPSSYNDIALVKLSKEVEFNEFIRPACLHTGEGLPDPYAVSTGWPGRHFNTLVKVNLTIVPHEEEDCASGWSRLRNEKIKDGILDSKMICARDPHNLKDTCLVHSGGPLQIRLDAPYCVHSIIGVSSFGTICGTRLSRLSDIFTRVSYYVPWIEAVVWPTFEV